MRYGLFVYILFCCITLYSQNDDYVLKPPRDYEKNPAKNAAFIELGGNAGLYSLNFDRIYVYKPTIKLSGRAGYAPAFIGKLIEHRCVLENNFILLNSPHHLEFGVGVTLHRSYNQLVNDSTKSAWENSWFSVLRCGYRYQKHDGGWFFRAALTPVFAQKNAEGFNPNYFQFWAGFSVGTSF